jgi:bifunctional enzyme CysN/CysC
MYGSVETTATAAAEAGARAPLLFIVCGAAGDGKSALVGRLFDGLEAAPARDAAGYRRFAGGASAFLAAETTSTRELTLAAAQAQLAVLVVDASRGLRAEGHRHAILASLSGIRHLVLAVNKIDRVGYDRAAFYEICEGFRGFAEGLGFVRITCIPLAARDGDNIAGLSDRMPWYKGPALRDYLDAVEAEDRHTARPLRMAVESVAAVDGLPSLSGTLASGALHPGDSVAVLPSGRTSTAKALSGPAGALSAAKAGDAVTVTLADAIAVAAGDMLAPARDRPQVADQFVAHVVWMSHDRLLPERSYLMRINGATLAATVTDLKHRIDLDSLAKLAAKTLGRDEIGVCNLALGQPIAFDSYADNHATGAFLLLDRESNETVAAGMIDFALRRASNIHYQDIIISKAERAGSKGHRPAVLWFTGLSGAGKSTIANLVEAGLHARGAHTVLLDGDNIRHGLNRDLGFTEADRVENIRRIGEVAKLMTDAGLIVLCSFISPFRAERRMVRELLEEGEFVEIFVDTPLDECIVRDPKGLYRRALAGEIKNFTGVDQAYETPENPELRLEAGVTDAEALAHDVIERLGRLNIL